MPGHFSLTKLSSDGCRDGFILTDYDGASNQSAVSGTSTWCALEELEKQLSHSFFPAAMGPRGCQRAHGKFHSSWEPSLIPTPHPDSFSVAFSCPFIPFLQGPSPFCPFGFFSCLLPFLSLLWIEEAYHGLNTF